MRNVDVSKAAVRLMDFKRDMDSKIRVLEEEGDDNSRPLAIQLFHQGQALEGLTAALKAAAGLDSFNCQLEVEAIWAEFDCGPPAAVDVALKARVNKVFKGIEDPLADPLRD